MTRRPSQSGSYPSVRPEPASATPLPGPPSSLASGAAVVHGDKIGTGPGLHKARLDSRPYVQWGERLRVARESIGWSQQQLADKWGITRRAVISYETGRTLVPINMLEWAQGIAAARRTGT